MGDCQSCLYLSSNRATGKGTMEVSELPDLTAATFIVWTMLVRMISQTIEPSKALIHCSLFKAGISVPGRNPFFFLFTTDRYLELFTTSSPGLKKEETKAQSLQVRHTIRPVSQWVGLNLQSLQALVEEPGANANGTKKIPDCNAYNLCCPGLGPSLTSRP